jgi:hypothetical protein
MTTKLEAALKADYQDYKKQLADFEKQRSAIEKKIVALNKKYAQVLDLMKVRTKKRKPGAKRAKRGQSKELILAAVTKSKKPIRAVDIIHATSGKLSAASVRQQLPKLVKAGALKKNKDKAYTIGKKGK